MLPDVCVLSGFVRSQRLGCFCGLQHTRPEFTQPVLGVPQPQPHVYRAPHQQHVLNNHKRSGPMPGAGGTCPRQATQVLCFLQPHKSSAEAWVEVCYGISTCFSHAQQQTTMSAAGAAWRGAARWCLLGSPTRGLQVSCAGTSLSIDDASKFFVGERPP